MTQDEIIEMARVWLTEFGIQELRRGAEVEIEIDELEAFAKLVAARTLSNIDPSSFMSWQEGFEAGAAKEREACAKMCETFTGSYELGKEMEACAAAIRARGEA